MASIQPDTEHDSEEAGAMKHIGLPDPDSPTAWMADGLCRLHPPTVFFPSDGVGVDKARKICAGCPVKDRCLDHALEHRIEHGVWGGCSERERRRILKRRRLEAAALNEGTTRS
jgi:WhiB family redox-sensing transcriptional regulator